MLTCKLTTIALASTLVLAAGCSSTRYESVSTAPAGPAYSSQAMQYGYVRNISTIDARHASGAGAVIGGVVGAVLGNQIGSGTGRAAATGNRAGGCASIGNKIEENRASGTAYHLQARLGKGGIPKLGYSD